MDKFVVRYNEAYAIMNQKKYDKDNMFDYILDEREQSKDKNIEKKENSELIMYNLIINGNQVCIKFPRMFIKNNKEYISALETIFNYEKRQNSKLKVYKGIIILLTGVCLSSPLLKYRGEIESFYVSSNLKSYVDNIKQINSIKKLEKEILSHTNRGSIDGFLQTIEEHNMGKCYLGKNVKASEIDVKITEYCEANNLGEEVIEKAIEKFDLYTKDEVKQANSIDLLEVYKSSLEKGKNK